MILPEKNDLVHLEHDGKVTKAIVDRVQRDPISPSCRMITVSLGAPLEKSDACIWIDDDGNRAPVSVEDSTSDWGLTTIRLRLNLENSVVSAEE